MNAAATVLRTFQSRLVVLAMARATGFLIPMQAASFTVWRCPCINEPPRMTTCPLCDGSKTVISVL